MWTVFFVAMPQLQVTYELRLRYADRSAWDCLIFVQGKLRSSFSGDDEMTANDLWSRVFEAIGVNGLAMTGD